MQCTIETLATATGSKLEQSRASTRTLLLPVRYEPSHGCEHPGFFLAKVTGNATSAEDAARRAIAECIAGSEPTSELCAKGGPFAFIGPTGKVNHVWLPTKYRRAPTSSAP
jgi:hypothetical protein